MFSKRSAGPFFSKTRRAMAPISRSQSTSAAMRRSSPSFSRRVNHCRRSMKLIEVAASARLTPVVTRPYAAPSHLSRSRQQHVAPTTRWRQSGQDDRGARSISGIAMNDVSAYHGQVRGRLPHLTERSGERVAVQHGEVGGEAPGQDATFAFCEGHPGATDGQRAQGLNPREALRGAEDLAR